MSQAGCVTGRGEGVRAGRVSLLAPPWHDTSPARERGEGGRERRKGPEVEVTGAIFLLEASVSSYTNNLDVKEILTSHTKSSFFCCFLTSLHFHFFPHHFPLLQ